MRAVLKLECIGDNSAALCRLAQGILRTAGMEENARLFAPVPGPWVARITGPDPRFGFAREFLRGQKDYSEANSVGSRGVYLYFALPPGIYEVNDLVSWKRTDRYFCRVEGEKIYRISKEEVKACFPQTAQSAG